MKYHKMQQSKFRLPDTVTDTTSGISTQRYTFTILCTSFWGYGRHAWQQYSWWGITNDLCKFKNIIFTFTTVIYVYITHDLVCW